MVKGYSPYGDSIGSLPYNGMNRDQLRRYVRWLHAALWRWESGIERLIVAMAEDDAAEGERLSEASDTADAADAYIRVWGRMA